MIKNTKCYCLRYWWKGKQVLEWNLLGKCKRREGRWISYMEQRPKC